MIKSTVEIVHNQSFQCGLCVLKMGESARESRKNCTGKNKRVRKLDEISYSKCPGNFYNVGYALLLDVHKNFRKGVMAYPGGLLDQPAKFIEAMNLIENIVSAKEIDRMNAQAKAKGARRGRK